MLYFQPYLYRLSCSNILSDSHLKLIKSHICTFIKVCSVQTFSFFSHTETPVYIPDEYLPEALMYSLHPVSQVCYDHLKHYHCVRSDHNCSVGTIFIVRITEAAYPKPAFVYCLSGLSEIRFSSLDAALQNPRQPVPTVLFVWVKMPNNFSHNNLFFLSCIPCIFWYATAFH